MPTFNIPSYTTAFVVEVRNRLFNRYPNYSTLPNSERVLLAMSSLYNDFHIMEIGENNHGPMVKAILGSVGLSEGYPWCASAVELACLIANCEVRPRRQEAAAVVNWWHWAVNNGRATTEPKRGRLCLLLHGDGTGHMGDVAEVINTGRVRIHTIRTYEGNTSSGLIGSQRDGDGLFMRTRLLNFWQHFIDLD